MSVELSSTPLAATSPVFLNTVVTVSVSPGLAGLFGPVIVWLLTVIAAAEGAVGLARFWAYETNFTAANAARATITTERTTRTRNTLRGIDDSLSLERMEGFSCFLVDPGEESCLILRSRVFRINRKTARTMLI